MAENGKPIATERSPLLRSNPSDISSPTRRSIEEAAIESAVPDSDGKAAQSLPLARVIPTVLALGLLIFFQATNMSGLTTTQSAIAADLDAYESANWFASAYLVAMSSTAPLLGRLSHIFSPRFCIFVSTLVFSLGSLVAGLSDTLPVFLLGRAVAGVGAAGIFTVSIILVLQLTGPKRRGLCVGLLNTGYTVGVATGAVLAGALEPRIGWRALFWAQSPITASAALVLVLSIPSSFTAGKQTATDLKFLEKLRRIDYAGATLLVSCLVLTLVGLSGSKIMVLPVLLGLCVIPVFVLTESRFAKDPVIPVVVMKSRGTLLSCFATLGFMMARWMVLFYTPVYAIAVRGWSPASAGAILIPTNAGFALGGLTVGFVHIRRTGSFWLACVIVFALFPVTLACLGLASTPDSPAGLYVLATFVNGMCAGATLNYTLAHVLHLTLPETHFIVSSLLATFRGFAGSFGSAIGGGIFTRILKTSLHEGFEREGLGHKNELIRRLIGSPALVARLVGVEKQIAVESYAGAVRGVFYSGVGLAIIMILVQAGTGWNEPVQPREEEQRSVEGTAAAGDVAAT